MSQKHPIAPCILLATHNGERYIAEQLDSIINQSYQDWSLLIRDDHSTDSTLKIIHEYMQRDKRIALVTDENHSINGACRNFGELVREGLSSPSEIFFFCDQDDVWHSDKIKIQIHYFETSNSHLPYLVHHDLEVVDENLYQLSKSFSNFMNLTPKDATLGRILGRNEVTGCTIACNRKLLEYSFEIPEEAIMHDWWLALIGFTLGEVRYLNETYIKYRQHTHNTIGAKSFWSLLKPSTDWLKGWKRGNNEFLSTLIQAEILLTHLENKKMDFQHDDEFIECVKNYTLLLKKPKLQRIRWANKHNFVQPHWLLRLINRLRLLTL